MSELQKYDILLFTKPTQVYMAGEVDAARAADKARIEELERHLKTSNGNVEHFERLFYLEQQKTEDAQARIELLQRAVEWCLENAVQESGGKFYQVFGRTDPIEVPAEFSDIIKAVKP